MDRLERFGAFLLPKVQRMDLREHLHFEKPVLYRLGENGGERKREKG